MMVDLYATDYGDARVSEREVAILQLAQDIRRNGDGHLPVFQHVLKMADAIHAACERFSMHSSGIV